MTPTRVLFYKLRVLTNISLIWVLFSFIFLYNILSINKNLLTDRNLIIFSLAFAIIGFVVSAALVFYLKYAFRHYPLWLSVTLKMLLTFVLFIVVSFILLLLYFVFSHHQDIKEFARIFYYDVFLTRGFLIFMIDLALMAFISIIFLEVTDKYGPGGFMRMMRGQYNKPRIEDRVFLFLDINDATSIAERLGHEKYFRMLKDFFADLTEPILANGAEIYQYVGDEVVLSWRSSPLNKIRCLRFIRHAYYILKRKEKKYMRRYGFAPSFKAGIHSGEVTAGFIGIIKKDLVYSGDTLNTAARIRSKCHELNQPFIISGDFLNNFNRPYAFQISEIGEMEFKGREEKERLYSVQFE